MVPNPAPTDTDPGARIVSAVDAHRSWWRAFKDQAAWLVANIDAWRDRPPSCCFVARWFRLSALRWWERYREKLHRLTGFDARTRRFDREDSPAIDPERLRQAVPALSQLDMFERALDAMDAASRPVDDEEEAHHCADVVLAALRAYDDPPLAEGFLMKALPDEEMRLSFNLALAGRVAAGTRISERGTGRPPFRLWDALRDLGEGRAHGDGRVGATPTERRRKVLFEELPGAVQRAWENEHDRRAEQPFRDAATNDIIHQARPTKRQRRENGSTATYSREVGVEPESLDVVAERLLDDSDPLAGFEEQEAIAAALRLAKLAGLSPTKTEVYRIAVPFIATGRERGMHRQIAEQLGIKESTSRGLWLRIQKKLGPYRGEFSA